MSKSSRAPKRSEADEPAHPQDTADLEPANQDAAADPTPPEPKRKVGYKSPPSGSRWKPGQSGNPHGRPKGAKSIASLLREELDKPIDARIGGRLVTMCRRRAVVQKQVELALKGDTRAFLVLLKLDPTLDGALASPAKAQAPPDPLSPEEQAIYQAFLQRHGAEPSEGARDEEHYPQAQGDEAQRSPTDEAAEEEAAP